MVVTLGNTQRPPVGDICHTMTRPHHTSMITATTREYTQGHLHGKVKRLAYNPVRALGAQLEHLEMLF